MPLLLQFPHFHSTSTKKGILSRQRTAHPKGVYFPLKRRCIAHHGLCTFSSLHIQNTPHTKRLTYVQGHIHGICRFFLANHRTSSPNNTTYHRIGPNRLGRSCQAEELWLSPAVHGSSCNDMEVSVDKVQYNTNSARSNENRRISRNKLLA